jgi:rod shape-determining protein MreC
MFSYVRNPRILVLAALLALAVLLGIMHKNAANDGRSMAIEDAVRVVVYPFQVAGNGIGNGGNAIARVFRTWGSLRRENKTLREDVRRLTTENSSLKEAAEENVRLRRELEFKASFPLPVVAGQVIGRNPSGWFSTCIIDRGSRDGVKIGHAVASFRGLVGQVLTTSPTSSSVQLLSDSDREVGALDQRSRVHGICKGQDSDVLLLKYLPKDADVKVGDVVVSSGIGRLVPKGLPIGRVVAVRPDQGGFTKHAEVRPSARFETLEDVFVVVRAVEE